MYFSSCIGLKHRQILESGQGLRKLELMATASLHDYTWTDVSAHTHNDTVFLPCWSMLLSFLSVEGRMRRCNWARVKESHNEWQVRGDENRGGWEGKKCEDSCGNSEMNRCSQEKEWTTGVCENGVGPAMGSASLKKKLHGVVHGQNLLPDVSYFMKALEN